MFIILIIQREIYFPSPLTSNMSRKAYFQLTTSKKSSQRILPFNTLTVQCSTRHVAAISVVVTDGQMQQQSVKLVHVVVVQETVQQRTRLCLCLRHCCSPMNAQQSAIEVKVPSHIDGCMNAQWTHTYTATYRERETHWVICSVAGLTRTHTHTYTIGTLALTLCCYKYGSRQSQS